MSELTFTPLAVEDLDDILAYIARDRPDTAVRIVGEIRQKCEFLAQNPLAGEMRPEISPMHRCWSVRRWVIFYRELPGRIEIHRVLDGARDLGALFSA
jgi:toxin ParE1/3/4